MRDPQVARWRAAALVATLVVACAIALGGCATKPPTEPPGITGTVTSVVSGDERPASMLVEGPTPQPTGALSDKAVVTIATSTQFFGKTGAPASPSSVKQGVEVRVWFEGAVAESYPVQGTARAVQVSSD